MATLLSLSSDIEAYVLLRSYVIKVPLIEMNFFLLILDTDLR